MAVQGIITGLLWMLASSVVVDVCVEPSFESAVAVMRLGRHSPGLDLRPVRPERCDAGAGYRARFATRRDSVALVLSTPTGERLERSVPWASRSEDALIDVARRGRLGALAILLGGLVLEDRALRAVEPHSPALASEKPVPLPAAQLATVHGSLESRGPQPAPPTTVRIERSRPAAPATEPDPDVRRTTRRAPRVRIASTAARALAQAGPDAPPQPRVRPAPPPEPAPFPDDGPSPPVAPVRDGGAVGGPGRVRAVTPRRPPSRTEADPHLGLGLGAALRAPSVLGLEAALQVDAWDLSLEVGMLPPLVWELEGRPLELASAWLALGWSLPTWRTAVLEVDGRVSAVIERLTVLRLELPDAMTRAVWDAGLDASVALLGPMGGGWRIGGRLGVRWLATANDVRIPEGPRAPLNAWQCRVGLVVDWAP